MADPGIAGFGTLGYALSGGAEQEGANAYQSGMRVGAQTADAIAQARDRVQKSQNANEAGDALESPDLQKELNISPAQGHLAATYARMGKDVTEVTNFVKGAQENNARRILGDPNQAPSARMGADAQLAPSAYAPKPEGASGSFSAPLSLGYNPDAPASDQNSPVHVSDQQIALNDASVTQKRAAAAAAGKNADAHMITAERPPASQGAPGAPKLQAGYQWDVDLDKNSPTYGNVKNNPDGTPRQIPNPTAGNGEGAYSRNFHENMLGSASGAHAELTNLMDLGAGKESVGLSNVAGAHGLLGTLSTDLGRQLSSPVQQLIHQSYANIGRYVATVENGGRPPPAGVVSPLQQSIEALPTDSVEARVNGLATIRQDLEAQLPRVMASTASPAIKREFEATIERIKTTVPFLPQDVRDWMNSGKSATVPIGTWVKARGGSSATVSPSAGAAPTSAAPPGLTVVN